MRVTTLVLFAAVALGGCASPPPPTADSYTGKWSGTWQSTDSPGASNKIEADLRGSGDRLEGTVKFISVLGSYTLPIAQALPKKGPVRVKGFADASNGASKVLVNTSFERKGDRIEGTYDFPVIQDRGTFQITKSEAR